MGSRRKALKSERYDGRMRRRCTLPGLPRKNLKTFSPLSVRDNVIPAMQPNESYKYLGLNINMQLNFQETIHQLVNKFKKIVHLIVSKRYLGPRIIVKLINTTALPKLGYVAQFLSFDAAVLQDLDSFVTTILDRTFQIPTHFSQRSIWIVHHKLKLPSLYIKARFLSAHVNLGLNSNFRPLSSLLHFNHFQAPVSCFNSLPPLTSLLNEFSLSIAYFPPLDPPKLPDTEYTHVDIFTDASVNPKDLTASFGVFIPQLHTRQNFPATAPLVSTIVEEQAILKALLLTLHIHSITLYTDSLPSINSMQSFSTLPKSQQITSDSFFVMAPITTIINLRKSSGFLTKIHHVYSHLLDKDKPTDYERKMKEMKEKFPSNYKYVLRGNRKADKIATSERHSPVPLDLSTHALPEFTLIDSSFQPQMSINRYITQQSLFKHLHLIKRSKWLACPSVDLPLTLNSKTIAFQTLFLKLSQSLIMTRERSFKFYQQNRPHIPQKKLALLRQVYNSPQCPICPNNPTDNHEHGNSSCLLAMELHKRMTKKLQALISKSTSRTDWKFTPWYNHNFEVPRFSRDHELYYFPKDLGDKGIIPRALRSYARDIEVKDPTGFLEEATKIIHTHIAAKWKLRHIIYFRCLSLTEVLNNAKILSSLNIS
jgi:ribonuclease HI